ncbi:MAG: serine hydrolase [Streptosporangiaceae bacterium]
MPPLALTWAQGAGAIVSSLQDMTTWDRDLYQGRELPPRQQRQLESLISETTGKPITTTTPADPAGYGLGVQQLTYQPIGTVWTYEGGTLGYRAEHYYFPDSGIIIALAVNSATDAANDQLGTLAVTVYQTLQKADAGSSPITSATSRQASQRSTSPILPTFPTPPPVTGSSA